MKCLIINARNPLGPVSEIQPLDVRKARLLPFFFKSAAKPQPNVQPRIARMTRMGKSAANYANFANVGGLGVIGG